CQQHHNSPWTF
nr:immunoglobulin light chain junction region [Macaca mulatta]